MKNPTMEGKLQRFNLDERARGSLGVKKGLFVSKEDDLDLKETDEATHNSNKMSNLRKDVSDLTATTSEAPKGF